MSTHCPTRACSCFCSSVGRRREQQDPHARTPVRGLLRGEFAIDPGLTSAADHRGRKARHGDGRLPCPARRIGSDRQRGRAHAKGFRERIVDPHAFHRQDTHGTNSNGSGRAERLFGDLKKLESQTVALLIVVSHPALDSAVALRLDRQRAAEAAARDIAVANDKLAILEHEGAARNILARSVRSS